MSPSDLGPIDAGFRSNYLCASRSSDPLINPPMEMTKLTTQDVWLIRHGETQWTVSRRHTGLTNLPLTLSGEEQAKALRRRLKEVSLARVFSSPFNARPAPANSRDTIR